jgi:hypothetical protein
LVTLSSENFFQSLAKYCFSDDCKAESSLMAM